MPSPKCALRWLWFSPVPNQSTSESFGSITTQHRLNDGPLSKMGENDTPRFSVFHNPPNAEATYQTLVFRGSISTSAIRPVTNPGPIERQAMPSSRLASRLPCPSAEQGTRSVAAIRNRGSDSWRIDIGKVREAGRGLTAEAIGHTIPVQTVSKPCALRSRRSTASGVAPARCRPFLREGMAKESRDARRQERKQRSEFDRELRERRKRVVSMRNRVLVVLGVLAVAAVAYLGVMRRDGGSGRVWSAEHGHWHDK